MYWKQQLNRQKNDAYFARIENHAGPFVLGKTFRKHYLIRAKAACPSSKRTSLILSATPAIPFLR